MFSCDAVFFLAVYSGDDTFIPKNSSVIVNRVPAMGGGMGLLSRLRGERPEHSRYTSNSNLSLNV